MPPHRILVATPDPTVPRILREELSAVKYEIDTVAGAEDALAKIAAWRPVVFVTELDLPDGRAVDLLPRVAKISRETKTLVVARHASSEELISLLRQHAFAFFHKPFSQMAFADMVREAIACTSCDDDIVLLSAVPHWVTVQMSSRMSTVDRVVQFCKEFEIDLPPDDRDQIATALHELLMNAVEHGGRSDPNNKVLVTRLRTDNFIGFYISDPGEGFSFDDLPHAAVSNPGDEVASHLDVRQERGMRPGGFGISMARNLLDGLYYNEKGNEVILIKNVRR